MDIVQLLLMAEKIRVLVIDEDIESLTKLYIGLLQLGYNVEVSDQIEEITQRLNRFKPEIFLISEEFVSSSAELYSSISNNYQIPSIILYNENASFSAEYELAPGLKKPLQMQEVVRKIGLTLKKSG